MPRPSITSKNVSQHSENRRAWNKFYGERYKDIVRMAKKHTRDPYDLVHHTYLRCMDKPLADNPMAYVSVAMFREATRGKFKEIYKIVEGVASDAVAPSPDLTKSIQREDMQLVIDRLSWFDRHLMNLYLDGWKMVEVAEGTGINVSVLYQSLHRSKIQIIDAIRSRDNKI